MLHEINQARERKNMHWFALCKKLPLIAENIHKNSLGGNMVSKCYFFLSCKFATIYKIYMLLNITKFLNPNPVEATSA